MRKDRDWIIGEEKFRPQFRSSLWSWRQNFKYQLVEQFAQPNWPHGPRNLCGDDGHTEVQDRGPPKGNGLGQKKGEVQEVDVHFESSFHDNPRCVTLVNAFSDGVALHAVGSGDRMSVTVKSTVKLRYKWLRQQLTLEFSIRLRPEVPVTYGPRHQLHHEDD